MFSLVFIQIVQMDANFPFHGEAPPLPGNIMWPFLALFFFGFICFFALEMFLGTFLPPKGPYKALKGRQAPQPKP